jgi:hypothetical protein
MFKQYDTAFQDSTDGQMYVAASDDSGNKVPTGMFFEIPTGVFAKSPWAQAQQQTADLILPQLEAKLPPEVKLRVSSGKDGLQYEATLDGRTARASCGLLASDIGRTTAVLPDGKGGTITKQSPDPALTATADALMKELATET